jgi:hypothetical protein
MIELPTNDILPRLSARARKCFLKENIAKLFIAGRPAERRYKINDIVLVLHYGLRGSRQVNLRSKFEFLSVFVQNYKRSRLLSANGRVLLSEHFHWQRLEPQDEKGLARPTIKSKKVSGSGNHASPILPLCKKRARLTTKGVAQLARMTAEVTTPDTDVLAVCRDERGPAGTSPGPFFA